MRNWKIAPKLLAMLLVCALLPLLFVAVLSVTTMRGLSVDSTKTVTELGIRTAEDSRAALQSQAEEYLEKIAREQALKIDATLEHVQQELSAVAQYLTGLYTVPDRFLPLTLPYPYETENGIPSGKYMVAPGVQPSEALEREIGLLGNVDHMASTIYGSNESMSNLYLGTPSGIVYRYSARNDYDAGYDPRLRPWYGLAVRAGGRAVWSETEIDIYGILCTTVAMAYFDEQGALLGVVASDITLEHMQQDITSTRIGETGYAFLVEENGEPIAHPRMDQDTGHLDDLSLLPGLELFTGRSGLFEAELAQIPYYVAYQRLPSTGWYFAVVSEVAEITAPALAAAKGIEDYLHESQQALRNALWGVVVRFIAILTATLLLIIPLSFLLARTITLPVKQLLKATRYIGAGELHHQCTVTSNDEIADLARAFNEMGTKLRAHIDELTQLTMQREKAATELVVAAKIQAGMLPPALENGQGFALWAAMHPAREVGGDFYDFFMLDDARLYFCIADVSGKGVPAALYMAKAKTLLADSLHRTGELAAAIQSANLQLAAGNEENMFVTAFAALLNIHDGTLCYINAGHNPPILQNNGGAATLLAESDLVLGCLPDTQYKLHQITLDIRDRLVLYTDGVTEAEGMDGAFYTDSRLVALLEENYTSPCRDLSDIILGDISAFAQGAAQSDDITLLVLEKQ